MRKAPNAVAVTIAAIAAYFVLFWGYEALRALLSPSYGLDDVWRSQVIFSIGRIFHLAPQGLLKLAAFFEVMKLAAAIVFALHIAGRVRAMLAGGKADSEIVEAAIILAALISAGAALPALWLHNAQLMHGQVLELVLAGLAAALVIVERNMEAGEQPAPVSAPIWFAPWR